MQVIDARSGSELHPGSRIRYPLSQDAEGFLISDGDGFDVVSITTSAFHGSAVVRRQSGELACVPLVVRYTHPGSFLRPVAFFPS
jgi:hypothetical protein